MSRCGQIGTSGGNQQIVYLIDEAVGRTTVTQVRVALVVIALRPGGLVRRAAPVLRSCFGREWSIG